jgi:hypothetical protein
VAGRPWVGKRLADHFDSNYSIDQQSGCWLWNRHTNGGYGVVKIDKKTIKAHRYSYQRHFGDIPEGLVVMHSCDTPRCVNPDHLILGSQADNIRDMAAKGRHRGARGVANGRCKLTPEDVATIRGLVASGRTRASVAMDFSVSRSLVSQIALGQAWGHS